MPRTARKKSSTNIYHVVIKGIDRQIIFEENMDFKKYIEILALYKQKCHFKLFAYCLLSNHVHLILQNTDISLETIFRKINTHYATWFNMKYQRTGHIQDGRYYSEPIEDDSYLLNAIKYIHLNPTHAGLESEPGYSYRWSSIFEYKSKINNLVDTKYIFSIFNLNDLFSYKSINENCRYIDIDNIKKRIPDDVAKNIILRECACSNATEFASLPLLSRDNYILKLHSLGLSVRQLNRLTGISRGKIQLILDHRDTPSDKRSVPT